jgi:hypothetical protein
VLVDIVFPGYVDGDPLNLKKENQTDLCELCASYHRLGEKDPQQLGREMTRDSLVALVPELSAADLNLLHWALSLALKGPAERENAQRVMQELQPRVRDAKHGYGSMRTQEFREAMSYLTDGEYGMRDASELRMVFSPRLLTALGEAAKKGADGFADCSQWRDLTEASRKKMTGDGTSPEA